MASDPQPRDDAQADLARETTESARLIERVRARKVALTKAAGQKPPLRNVPQVLAWLLVLTVSASVYRWTHLPVEMKCFVPPDTDVVQCSVPRCADDRR